jgi:hypothetical protein
MGEPPGSRKQSEPHRRSCTGLDGGEGGEGGGGVKGPASWQEREEGMGGGTQRAPVSTNGPPSARTLGRHRRSCAGVDGVEEGAVARWRGSVGWIARMGPNTLPSSSSGVAPAWP